MSTIGQISRALRDVEAAMPPLALALHRATPAVLAAYRTWQRTMATWHERHGVDAFERWINGTVTLPAPPAALIYAGIVPPMRTWERGTDMGAAWATRVRR